MNNIKNFLVLFSFVAIFSPLFAKKDIEPIAFKAGSNVCFVGDSITNGGHYIKNIVQFYATRFPLDRVDFYNVGISGDTVAYVNKRLNDDVLSLKPQVATLMIGMNNTHYYQKPNMNAWRINKIKENRQMYVKNLDEIVSKFATANCKLILFTPSPYDETANLKKKADIGKNAELAYFSDVCKRVAYKNCLAVVDMWRSLMDFNAKLQKDFPDKSVAGKDRVHPEDFGGFAMMANFIKTVGETKEISTTIIDAKKSEILENYNCDISNLSVTDNGIFFDSFEYALPFSLQESAELGEKYTDFLKEYNKQIFRVSGLKNGKYSLFIDGENVGDYSSESLDLGINLAANTKTPQYKQAEKVAEACAKFRLKSSMLRRINATEMWHKLYELNTFEEKVARLDNLLKEGKIKHPYIKECAKIYKNTKPKQAEMFKETRVLFDKIYEAAQPKKHKYELKKVD